jgi:FkbM family methyltransferase
VIDFSRIDCRGFLGRLLRLPLALIPSSAVWRIKQGPLEGYRWVVGSATHGCWLGSYEAAKQAHLAKVIQKGHVVYDIGANVGFYSLLAAQCSGSQGTVHAFEPLPENLEYLRRHVALNEARNITVHPVAVSDHAGTMQFARGENRSTGQLGGQGDLIVKTVVIDELVFTEYLAVPQVMKIDVEGAEKNVLQGAQRVLQEHHPIIFLATHGCEVHRECCELLRGWGYTVSGLDGESAESTDELLCRPATLLR